MSPHDLGRVPGDPQVLQAVANRDSSILQSRSNYNVVKDGIARAEQELVDAEKAYAEAWARGDGLGVAQAQRAQQDAQYRLNTMQTGQEEIVSQAQQRTLEEILASMPALTAAEKQWCREHPDAVLQNQHRLRTAYEDSQYNKIERGSEDYFRFIEDRVYRPTEPESWAPARGGNGNSNGGGERLRPGQVKLSEAQQAHAKASGVTLEEYARGVKQLETLKKQGHYPNM